MVNLKLAVNMVKRIVPGEKYEIFSASSGPQCLELCEKHEFCFIFLDIIMPEMHGDEVAKRLRKQNQHYGNDLPSVVIFIYLFSFLFPS